MQDIYKNCTLSDIQKLDQNGIELFMYPTTTLCIEGKLDILKYVVSLGASIDITCVRQVCYNGHLDMLKYMFEQLGQRVTRQIENIIPYYTEYYPFRHLHILQYLHKEQKIANCEQMHNIHTYARWIGKDFDINVFYYMLLDMNIPIDKLVSRYDIYDIVTYDRSDIILTLMDNEYIESLQMTESLIDFTIRNIHTNTNILEILLCTHVIRESYILTACNNLNFVVIKYFYDKGYASSTLILSNISSTTTCTMLVKYFKSRNDYSWR